MALALSSDQQEQWMLRLVKRAEEVGKEGEIPITALILDKNANCIGYGRNNREKQKNPLGHAELIALRQAAWIKGDWRFNDCTLIVTLEPCHMCAGALIQARVGQVIFGAPDKKRGGFGGTIDLSKSKGSHHKMIVIGGVKKDLVKDQLKLWFKQLR